MTKQFHTTLNVTVTMPWTYETDGPDMVESHGRMVKNIVDEQVKQRIYGVGSVVSVYTTEAEVYETGYVVQQWDVDDVGCAELKTMVFETEAEQQAVVAMLRAIGHDPHFFKRG